MTIKKQSNTHTSARSKKKTAAKASKSISKSASNRNTADTEQQKRLEKLTLKVFQTVYDDYQQGKFRRIL
jgi:hypothetical protein